MIMPSPAFESSHKMLSNHLICGIIFLKFYCYEVLLVLLVTLSNGSFAQISFVASRYCVSFSETSPQRRPDRSVHRLDLCGLFVAQPPQVLDTQPSGESIYGSPTIGNKKGTFEELLISTSKGQLVLVERCSCLVLVDLYRYMCYL